MIKWIGILIIVSGCAWFGCMLASTAKKEVISLKKLIAAIEIMVNELQYHLTPLPDLCRIISVQSTDCIQHFFLKLADELDSQIAPNVDQCIKYTLQKCKDIPIGVKRMLMLLGDSLGKYDLEGQLSGLIAVKESCKQLLEPLQLQLSNKLKTYRTLGFCTGLMVAIIFV